MHGATLGHPPSTGSEDSSPQELPPPPPLCKLFAKAFISVATPPCARVSVATSAAPPAPRMPADVRPMSSAGP